MDGIIDELMGLLEDAFDEGLNYELLRLLEDGQRRTQEKDTPADGAMRVLRFGSMVLATAGAFVAGGG